MLVAAPQSAGYWICNVQHLSEPFKSYESKYIPRKKKMTGKKRSWNWQVRNPFGIAHNILCVYRIKESCILLRERATSWMILMFATVYCINIKLNVTTQYARAPSSFPRYRNTIWLLHSFHFIAFAWWELWTVNEKRRVLHKWVLYVILIYMGAV